MRYQDAVTTGNVLAFRAKPSSTITSDEFEPHYLDDFCKKLEPLYNLPDDWDGYNAKGITPRAFANAVLWGGLILKADTPLPDVFPVPNGNIQLEWSENGIVLEVEILSISKCSVYFENIRTGNNWTKTFQSNLQELIETVGLLSQPNQFAQAAG